MPDVLQDSPRHSADSVPAGGRVVAIDILRGFAILWVVLYHLWTDLRYPSVFTVREHFGDVPERLFDGRPLAAATSLGDAFLRVGYLGVPLFMILSGLSLTLVATRRDWQPSETPRFLYQRLRRVLVPYWFGFAFTLAFAAALGFVQWQRHGGRSLADYVVHGDISLAGDQLIAGALIVPRLFKHEWQFAPEGSLWFVALIVQYYLLFPLLFALLRRAGPWLLVALTFTVTAASLNIVAYARGDLASAPPWVEMLAPFRIFEFGLGMALGSLIAARSTMLAYARSRFAAPVAALGLALFVSANLTEAGDTAETLQGPAIALAMTLVALPLLAKRPAALEVSPVARLLAWTGVISYTVLIVSEPLRSITHHMRAERASEVWLALWALGVYMPLTLIAARPLAVLLGLTERQRPSVLDVAAPLAPVETPALRT
jgi:peptidoglycan/LPS O-acetylase OafA/YrhL